MNWTCVFEDGPYQGKTWETDILRDNLEVYDDEVHDIDEYIPLSDMVLAAPATYLRYNLVDVRKCTAYYRLG